MVKLTSSDNQEFQVEENVIFQSALIKNMLNDLEVEDAAIPLPNVTGHILQKGIGFLIGLLNMLSIIKMIHQQQLKTK